MCTDDPQDSFNRNNGDYPDIPNYERPPEDQPDDGMGTAREEVLRSDLIPPELKDGGMSAGYPPLRDDDLLPEPVVPVVKPEPSSMKDAPLFSLDVFESPVPGTVFNGIVTSTQDEDHKVDDVKKTGEK